MYVMFPHGTANTCLWYDAAEYIDHQNSTFLTLKLKRFFGKFIVFSTTNTATSNVSSHDDDDIDNNRNNYSVSNGFVLD
jgi:hypothetical protein